MVFLERLAFVKSYRQAGLQNAFSETDAKSAADVVAVVFVAMLPGRAQFRAPLGYG